MTHNPALVKQLLGEQVAELFDGTIEVEPAKESELVYGNLQIGDKVTFKFKDENFTLRQFVVTDIKYG
jgi:hypothetical protein